MVQGLLVKALCVRSVRAGFGKAVGDIIVWDSRVMRRGGDL